MWDGYVTKFYKRYLQELGISKEIQAYIQTITLKKTLETICFEDR